MTSYNFNAHLSRVFGNSGFSTDTLSENDLSLMRSLVIECYKSNIQKNFPKDSLAVNRPIYEYHEISETINHASIWTKAARLLPVELVNLFMKSQLMTNIVEEFPSAFISDEENFGCPEVFFRLVRPNAPTDVGPLHADSWFWEANQWSIPDGFQRVKIWISLWSGANEFGFKYLPGSHNNDYKHSIEFRDGKYKPLFDANQIQQEIEIFKSLPGDFIIFNDNLLHGGQSTATNTRVSLEFTLILKNRFYWK